MNENIATAPKDLLSALVQQNQLLQEQQQAMKAERAANRIAMMKMEFAMRASLPADARPPWVSKDEAVWLLGRPIHPSGHHRRAISWLLKHGELMTTTSSDKLFLREEVMQVNQRLIAGEVVIPSTFN